MGHADFAPLWSHSRVASSSWSGDKRENQIHLCMCPVRKYLPNAPINWIKTILQSHLNSCMNSRETLEFFILQIENLRIVECDLITSLASLRLGYIPGTEQGRSKNLGGQIVVMSPSRAGGFSARLDSARDLFHFSSKLKIYQKKAKNHFYN